MKTPQITDSRLLREGRFLHLRELELTHPDGRRSAYEVVTRNREKVFGIVSILPLTRENEIILLRQYRSPLGRIGIEFPAGCAEVGKHATLEDAARCELLEETGYACESFEYVGQFSSSSGMTDETSHGFVARNCEKVSDMLDLDASEYIERFTIPYTQFDAFMLDEIARGSIIEPKMLAMMWWFRQQLQK